MPASTVSNDRQRASYDFKPGDTLAVVDKPGIRLIFARFLLSGSETTLSEWKRVDADGKETGILTAPIGTVASLIEKGYFKRTS